MKVTIVNQPDCHSDCHESNVTLNYLRNLVSFGRNILLLHIFLHHNTLHRPTKFQKDISIGGLTLAG